MMGITVAGSSFANLRKGLIGSLEVVMPDTYHDVAVGTSTTRNRVYTSASLVYKSLLPAGTSWESPGNRLTLLDARKIFISPNVLLSNLEGLQTIRTECNRVANLAFGNKYC